MKRFISILLALCLLLALCSSALARGSKTLTIAGGIYPDAGIEAFQKMHPDIEVMESNRYETYEIVEDAVSHADIVDLYIFHTLTSSVYQQLRDRGFLMPIEDAGLLRFVNELYPELIEACKNEGTICAVPISMISQFSIFVDPDAWTLAGLSEDDLPTTWGEFIKFLVEEGPSLVDTHAELSLINSSQENLSWYLLQSIENNYNAYRNKCEQDPGFDTEEFREILSEFSKMEYNVIANRGEKALFLMGLSPSVRIHNGKYLPLSFVKEESAVVPVGLIVAAVNPNSKNIPEAIELLHSIVEVIDPFILREMNPSVNTPVEDVYYAENLKQYEQTKNDYAARIKAANDNLARTELEQEWQQYDKTMQVYFTQYRYSASVESIQQYRNDIEGRLTPIYDRNIGAEEFEAVNKKREQFLNHHISADQYINELERRFVFSVLEDQ